jgi:hypothetical protein
MSDSDSVSKTIRDTIKSAQEFIDNTKRSLQEELAKTTPDVEHVLDRSLDEAGRALSNTMRSIDAKTTQEQLELLNGYRSFLQGQIAFVDERIRGIKKG